MRHGQHDPTVEPFDCCFAALNELASSGEDKAELLEHGERALWELNRRRDAALDLVAKLRRERNEARALAWGNEYGFLSDSWFAGPTLGAFNEDGVWEWDLPDWLACSVEPNKQEWWTE